MPSEFITPSECPVCGAAVPRKARACPGCGADERSGWNEEDTRFDGLDLPDHAFDEDEPASLRSSSHWFRNLTVVVMVVALILLFVF